MEVQQLQTEVETLKSKLKEFGIGYDKVVLEQASLNLTLQKQQTEIIQGMMETNQSRQQTDVKLSDLYQKASDAISEIRVEIAGLKRKEEHSSGSGSLLHVKNMIPEKLTKTEEWKSWKEDIEDFCDAYPQAATLIREYIEA